MNTLDLAGTWNVRFSDLQRGRPHFADRDTIDEARYLTATVPGEIHLDLIRHGLINEPTEGMNVLTARWVEEQIWSYRRTFDAAEVPAGARVWLAFDGLDYAARIVLNGQQIGTHENAFLPCRVEVTGKLRATGNVLAVHLDPGPFHVADKPVQGWYHSNAADQPLHKRHWLRKPQCQFSWDWSPRLINVGIHGGVRLEWSEEPARVEAVVPLVTVAEDLASAKVVARVFVEGLGRDAVNATLAVEIPELGLRTSATVTIKPGVHPVEVVIDVAKPPLWWPIGHGAQPLFTLRYHLVVAGADIAVPERRIAFRHVRVNQDPHPEGGHFFVIEINRRPIFCKGGNLVPADLIFARVDNARYDTLVARALEANFNLLRVWGGGIYESDHLFDLCDKLGILVWQEFIFACGKYPIHDAGFLANVMAEARHQVRRLATHPSLIVWCGNNENETAITWGLMGETPVTPDYALYHYHLPKLMQVEDPTRYYQPSSPYSPHGIDASASKSGDQHPWSIGFGDTDYRKYRDMDCRFSNEGGILGPVSLPTMLACLKGGPDPERVQSLAWQLHDNSVDSWQEPSTLDHQTVLHLGRDCRTMSIADYVYWGGLIQAEGLRAYIDNFRRRMFASAAAVFWMYNDCWPATRSWTIVDYYLRRTPSFHPVRRAFAPVSVVVAEVADEVVVFGINETPDPVSAELRSGLFTVAGAYPIDHSAAVVLPPNTSTRLAAFPRAQWQDPTREIAFAVLEREGRVLTQNRLILPLLKEMSWIPAQVSVRVEGGEAIFTSPTFALAVCIDLDGDELPDNFFDCLPGVPCRLPWTASAPPRVLYVGNP